jgi:elongation factor G
MAKREPSQIRNLAFIGHGDAGKTTLVEALLFASGAISREGAIDDGTTVSDHTPEEKARHNSIDLGVAYATSDGKHFNFLDAPGYPDFIGEAVSALFAADAAVIAVNALAGVMVNTRKLWQLASDRGLPRFLVVTKADQENVDFAALIASIQDSFGKGCIPVILPVDPGPRLKQVVNVLEHPDEVTGSLAEVARASKERLMDAIVEVDDQLMERYLEGATIAPDELVRAMRLAILRGRLVPILTTAARAGVGAPELLAFLGRFAPSPLELPSPKGQDPASDQEATREPSSPFSAYAFKCVSDPYVGKLAYLRVVSGAFSPESPLYNVRTKKGTKVGGLFLPFGKDLRTCDGIVAGDVAVVSKVEDLACSDTVCDPQAPIRFPALTFPKPMVSLAAEPKARNDEARLSVALQRMQDSDPTFRVTRDRQTAELIIMGMSTLHLDVTLARMKRRFEVEVSTRQPKIPYQETITRKAEGHHKHKKQTGGRGQFGEVYLRIEPLPRGEGFQFVDSVVGGRIPNQYIPAIEKGVRDVLEKGILSNCPVVDVQVEVYDGSYHVVDSDEISFKLAGAQAFKQAFLAAGPSLLEPIVNLEVTAPTRCMGDIMGNLTSRRGRLSGSDSFGAMQVIKALVPLAEILSYSTELRSMTGGEGGYTIEPSHYDVVPQRIMEAIIARSKAGKGPEGEEA